MAACRSTTDRKTPRLSLRLVQGREEALDRVGSQDARRRREMGASIADDVRAIAEHWDACGRRSCRRWRGSSWAHGNLLLDDIEEANKLPMAMALHMLRPITVPSRTFIAANSVVPSTCRT